jgi:hypothetical protein
MSRDGRACSERALLVARSKISRHRCISSLARQANTTVLLEAQNQARRQHFILQPKKKVLHRSRYLEDKGVSGHDG